MSWIKNLFPSKIRIENKEKKGVPEGIWSKCTSCESILYRADLDKNCEVCPKCNHHLRIRARRRLDWFLDTNSQQEIAGNLEPIDFLKFKDAKKYRDRILQAQKSTQEKDALITVKAALHGHPVVVACFEFAYMGGSMGSVVGERFVRAVDTAIENRCPLISFSASGGARMQEALVSLMQMGKTSAALAKLADEKLPFISVLTDPTMGGVSASFAMLGDVIIAEPGALIGFAGPRVIQQTVHETLPEGFQRSEFLLQHGAIDMIVDRREMRDTIARILANFMHKPQLVAHAG